MDKLDNKDISLKNNTNEKPDNGVAEFDSPNLLFPKPQKGKLNVAFLLICLAVAIIALAYFGLYQTGYIHVTRILDNGALFSGYWKMGEPFGEGILVTTNGELIEGVWENGKLNKGVVVAKEFTYMGGLKDYLPDGYGSCHYKSGVRYHGFWKDGVKSGLGKLQTP